MLPTDELMPPVKVLEVDGEGLLQSIKIDERYQGVLLLVHAKGAVVGRFWVRTRGVLTEEAQRDAISRCEPELRLLEAQRRLAVAAAVRPPETPPQAVSIVVCTHGRDPQLRACLASFQALRTRPLEIIVIDNAPSGDAVEELCREFGAVYVREEQRGLSRARNRGLSVARGTLVAFTDDDCEADARWLDGLAQSFADPLVMVVTGAVLPAELEADAQIRFEAHGGFARGVRAHVFDGLAGSPARMAGASGAGANLIVRRSVFSHVPAFDEQWGTGTLSGSGEDTYFLYTVLRAGFRVAYEPKRLVRHHHRCDDHALRRMLFAYGAGVSSFVACCVLRDRDISALRLYAWWWLDYICRDARRLARGRGPLTVPYLAAEVAGTLLGPILFAWCRLSRRRRDAIDVTPPGAETESAPLVMRSGTPRVSVVIPSRGRPELLAEVLRALERQTCPPDEFETIVVLDGADPSSAAVASSFSDRLDLAVLEQGHAGAAAARNNGLALARNPVTVFLDDDVVPTPGFVRAHANGHSEGSTRRVLLGYCSSPLANSPWAQMLRNWWEDRFRRYAREDHHWTYVDLLSGNVSLRTEYLRRLGGFDVRFGVGRREDWELGLRLLRDDAEFTFSRAASAEHRFVSDYRIALEHRQLEGVSDGLFAKFHPDLVERLPLAQVLRQIDGGLERRLLRGRSALDPIRHLNRRARLALYSVAGLRLRWLVAMSELSAAAYIDGLASAVPGAEARRALIERSRRQDATAWLDLNAPEPLDVPPEGLGFISLRVRDVQVGLVEGSAPGEQWDTEDWLRRAASTLAARPPTTSRGDARGAGGRERNRR